MTPVLNCAVTLPILWAFLACCRVTFTFALLLFLFLCTTYEGGLLTSYHAIQIKMSFK